MMSAGGLVVALGGVRCNAYTPSQLQQENLVFRGFKKGQIGLPAKYIKKIKKRSKDEDDT